MCFEFEYPRWAGSDGRRQTEPAVRSALQAAFGLTLNQLYEEVEALMAKRRGSAQPDRRMLSKGIAFSFDVFA